MFPEVTFLGLSLYDWCMIAGVALAFVIMRLCSDRLNIPAKLQNLVYIIALFSVCFGLFGAMLFQSVYHWIESGQFVWGGMTFYGGLICGAAIFLIGYFAIGKKYAAICPLFISRKLREALRAQLPRHIVLDGLAACLPAVATAVLQMVGTALFAVRRRKSHSHTTI